MAEAGLTAIVFPRISTTAASMDLRALSGPEAVERLTEAVFGRAGVGGPSALFDVVDSGVYPDPAARTAAAARLANDVLCLDVGLGPDAYQPGVIDGLLGKLFVS